jgi:archaellum biogenesis protein FlaJ (TadC family)
VVIGAAIAYLLLLFYENVRPSDATIRQDKQDRKQIANAIRKLAIQAGLIVTVVWLIVRLNSAFQ